MNNVREKLQAIQSGNIDALKLECDDNDDDKELEELIDDEDLDDDILSEVTLSIIESEIGTEKMEAFITENAEMLIRDGLLTEDAVGGAMGKSYIVLSPAARRQRAINLLKLKMARDAGDPRYKKLIIARKLVKSLLQKIREDGKYKKAETIVKRMKFKVVQNPEAVSAMKRAGAVKLQ